MTMGLLKTLLLSPGIGAGKALPPPTPFILEYVFTEGTAADYDIMYDKVHPAPEDPVVIDTSGTLSATYPPSQSMVRTSGDRIYVVYRKKLGTIYQIYVKYSDDEGDTWSDRFLLSDAAGMDGYSQNAQCIAIDSDDNLHVVWEGRATGYAKDQIWYRKYDGTWGTTTPVDPHAADVDQSEPSIAVDSEDTLHLIWAQLHTDDFINKTYYTKYNGSWATPIIISTAAGMDVGGQYTPVLAIDSSDYLHVVWRGRATGFTTNNQIWYAMAVPPYAAGNWVTPIRISTETGMETQTQGAACIAIDSGDNLHVVWYGKVAATFNKIWYVKYDGSWGTPIVISTADGMENYDQYSPVIAAGSTTDLHVIWEGKATGYIDQFKLWYAEYIASWATPEVIQPTGKNSFSNIRWSRWP